MNIQKKVFIAIITLLTFCSCSVLRQEDYAYNGIDVSHYQGNINWKTVVSNKNIKFVYIKATEGATWSDAKREIYARGAHQEKLLVGYYHFFRTSSSGADQFENFAKSIEGLPNDLIPVLDIEVEPKASEMRQFEQGINTFIKLCRKKYGVYPIIYTMPNFDKKYLEFCKKRKKWYAGRINENAIMTKCLMWQVAIQPVPGIAGNTDWDFCPKISKIRKRWANNF